MYEEVSRTGDVFTVFSVLAILVACLGLFGLSSFMVEQRGKEISIRKILGASIQLIFGMLTVNFLRLIAISLVLAIPISFYLMQDWLTEFEYTTDLHWSIFVIAGGIITIIAIGTISFESIKAALVNPVKGLRSE
ncbi:MAG: FtsX-like permease family protein [Bacteroidota bacterium]